MDTAGPRRTAVLTAPLGLVWGHLSKFYLIPEVLDLSVIVYERGD